MVLPYPNEDDSCKAASDIAPGINKTTKHNMNNGGDIFLFEQSSQAFRIRL